MVLTALNANNFTLTAITVETATQLQQEVDLTERSIRNAAGRQQFKVLHDARIIGNPVADPQDDSKLTDVQIAYRDTFVGAGYLVTLDADTGLWRISWEDEGVEAVVSVYTIRTTVVPGAVSALTIDFVDNFFDGLTPAARSRTELVNVGPGSDTDEADFGAGLSAFYEYIVIVRQQDPTIDHSADLRTALTGVSLGYIASPSNVFVYKIA